VLILVRHGQTQTNAEGRLLGRADPPLTELGRRQAATLVGAVGPVDRVVTSPLARARETAACFGLPVEVDERWVEIDYGGLEGRRLAEVPADVWRRWRSDLDFVPSGGESMRAVAARVRSACEALTGEAVEANVVVVSHVSPIKAAVAWALGAGDEVIWRLFLDVASVSRVGVGPGGPVLRTYNDTTHLPAD
jgi:broad specificity phosphatase PhoE